MNRRSATHLRPEARTALYRKVLAGLSTMLVAWTVTWAAVGDDARYVRAEVGAEWTREYDRLRSALDDGRATGALARTGRTPADLLDPNAALWASDDGPVDVVLRRTEALLSHLGTLQRSPDLSIYATRLRALRNRCATTKGRAKVSVAAEMELYMKACALRREVALSNPLLDFDTLVYYTWAGQSGYFQTHNYPTSSHGGDIQLLCNFKSATPTGKRILANSVFENGPMKGQRILEAGAKGGHGKFHTLDLSYDGKTIVFAWAKQAGSEWVEENTYKILRVNVDGSELMQLTSGTIFNNYSPCWLPNGRIAFISERGGGISRCMSPWQFHPSGTMFSMDADGSDIIPISYHETAETHPAVTNDGRIVYSRWDYVDRDWNFHSLWTCGPDGSDPRSPHGNYPFPHYVPDAPGKPDGRVDRPTAEHSFLPIPGSATKFVGIATSHHKPPLGVPIIVDISIPDDDMMSQVTRITDQCMPDELCEYPGDDGAGPSKCNVDTLEKFAEPYPLSEDFFLAGASNAIFLLDKFGNKELIFKGPSWCRYPIPLRSRPRPPVLPTRTSQGERASDTAPKATIGVVNVYESDFDWPPNTVITALRIIQLIPFPWRVQVNENSVGASAGGIARMVLGHVPVEEDGSAYFEAPVEREIYFQALDSLGCAVQSMRSGTYVHPGEQLSCVGCHEDRWSIPTTPTTSMAFMRAPSQIEAEPPGHGPTSYYRLMKPLVEGVCNPCHQKENKRVWDGNSYRYFADNGFYFHASGPCNIGVPLRGGSRTLAGRFGFRESNLGKKLLATHQDRLTREQLRRVAVWVDANSMEFGAYYDHDAQKAGEVVWPVRRENIAWPFIQVDPENPTGVERKGTAMPPPGRNPGERGAFASGGIAIRRIADRLSIRNTSSTPVVVTVWTPDGRSVMRRAITPDMQRTDIELGSLGRGLYIARAVTGSETKTIAFTHRGVR